MLSAEHVYRRARRGVATVERRGRLTARCASNGWREMAEARAAQGWGCVDRPWGAAENRRVPRSRPAVSRLFRRSEAPKPWQKIRRCRTSAAPCCRSGSPGRLATLGGTRRFAPQKGPGGAGRTGKRGRSPARPRRLGSIVSYSLSDKHVSCGAAGAKPVCHMRPLAAGVLIGGGGRSQGPGTVSAVRWSTFQKPAGPEAEVEANPRRGRHVPSCDAPAAAGRPTRRLGHRGYQGSPEMPCPVPLTPPEQRLCARAALNGTEVRLRAAESQASPTTSPSNARQNAGAGRDVNRGTALSNGRVGRRERRAASKFARDRDISGRHVPLAVVFPCRPHGAWTCFEPGLELEVGGDRCPPRPPRQPRILSRIALGSRAAGLAADSVPPRSRRQLPTRPPGDLTAHRRHGVGALLSGPQGQGTRSRPRPDAPMPR